MSFPLHSGRVFFAGLRIQGWQYLLSVLGKMLCHFHLASRVSDKKSAVIGIGVPYKKAIASLWILSRFFSLSLIFTSLITLLCQGFPLVCLIWVHLVSGICRFTPLLIWNVISHCLFKYFFRSSLFSLLSVLQWCEC